VELEDQLAKGLKAEVLSNYLPAKQAYGGKVNLYYKQPNLHFRTFFDLFKGPTANIDAVLGHEGFLVGAEAGYDVQKAAVTKYSAAIGYSLQQYAATIQATNNLSVFSASYYHMVNKEVEAGAKATWDSKAGNNVGLEIASKYKLDPSSFAKVSTKIILDRIDILKRAIRPRSTTAASQLWHTTSSSARGSPSASALPSTPRISARRLTRSALRSLSRDRWKVESELCTSKVGDMGCTSFVARCERKKEGVCCTFS
jgi:hypothetical protein